VLFFRRMRREDASLMVISRCWYRSQRHETDVLGRKDQSASFQNSATPLVCLNSLTEIVLVTVVVLFIVLTLWIADRKGSSLVKSHTVAILIVVLCCQMGSMQVWSTTYQQLWVPDLPPDVSFTDRASCPQQDPLVMMRLVASTAQSMSYEDVWLSVFIIWYVVFVWLMSTV